MITLAVMLTSRSPIESSFPLAVIPILLYLNHEYILTNPKFPLPAVVRQFLPVNTPNIWAPFLSLSGFDGYNESGQAVYKRSLKASFLHYHVACTKTTTDEARLGILHRTFA